MNGRSRHVGRFRDQLVERFVSDRELGFEIRVTVRPGGERLIEAIGDIDMLSAPALDRAVEVNLRARPAVLVINLSGVTFLASSGLASLMAALEGCRAAGIALRLVCVERRVLRPMELTGLIDLFEVYPDPESALRGGVRKAEG